MPDTSHTNETSAIRTARVQHECDTSDTSATRVLHVRRECDTSTTRTTRERHKREFLILITTRVKTYFHIPILAVWQMKDYKERINFILRNTSFPCQNAFEKCITKMNFVMAKAISKSYTLHCRCKCPYTFPHSYA